MKRFNWLLIGLVVLCLAMIPLAGCGISKSEYEALQTDYEALQVENASLVEENTTVKAELEGVQSDLAKSQADYKALQGENTSLGKENTTLKAELEDVQSDLTKSQADYKSVKSEYEALQAEHTTLAKEKSNLETELRGVQSDLTNAQAKYDAVKADYETANKELAEIKKVYPPRDFSSLKELRDWLLANDVSDRPPATSAESLYSKALEIQEDAFWDGYIVVACIYYKPETELWYVGCIAIIDGYVWGWGPETDEPVQFDLGKVK